MISIVQYTTFTLYWIMNLVSSEFTTLLNVYMYDQVSELQLQNTCFHYHVTNTIIGYELPMKPVLEIIEYCLRPLNETPIEESYPTSNITIWTFEKLREKQISSEQLYAWSAPIDTIERYEDYLNNPSAKVSTQVFYNCTHQFFGEYCQYSFDWSISFPQIVVNMFQLKEYAIDIEPNIPCYVHLPNCNHSTICLDWREICNRKLDCENGVDEYGCFSLEFNVCNDNEFQCQNGQCIPIELYYDDPLNPDCLDGTDERKQKQFYDTRCYLDPAFRCEERGFSLGFVCGDGGVDMDFDFTFLTSSSPLGCTNRRHKALWIKIMSHIENEILSFDCWKAMIAFLFPPLDGITLASWINMVEQNCDPIFFFPSAAAAFGHVFVVYTSDRAYNEQNRGQPIYVCFNVIYCPFIKPTIEINGSTCVSFLSLGLHGSSASKIISNTFRWCSLPNQYMSYHSDNIIGIYLAIYLLGR